jgi:hypothetical protein
MGTTSHRQASHQLTSPSSKLAGNPSLRPSGAVPLGSTGKAAKAAGRGVIGERGSGHVPQHPRQSRPRRGPLDAPCLLTPNYGTLPEAEMRPLRLLRREEALHLVFVAYTRAHARRDQECVSLFEITGSTETLDVGGPLHPGDLHRW